jgi:hypothetical protein
MRTAILFVTFSMREKEVCVPLHKEKSYLLMMFIHLPPKERLGFTTLLPQKLTSLSPFG